MRLNATVCHDSVNIPYDHQRMYLCYLENELSLHGQLGWVHSQAFGADLKLAGTVSLSNGTTAPFNSALRIIIQTPPGTFTPCYRFPRVSND